MKSAKELYEKHAGEYFYYHGEKVRLVGYSLVYYDSVIIASGYSEGWLKENLVGNEMEIINDTLFDEHDLLWFLLTDGVEFIKQ